MAAPLLDRLQLPIAHWHARRTLDRFLRAARDARNTQQRLLRTRLARNADSDFGRRFGFDRIASPDEFRRRVPIVTYADLAPYIDRVRAGETRALFGPGQSVLMFALTSGSAGTPKFIPVTRDFLADYRRGWNAWGLRALLDHPGCFLRSIVQVASPMDESHTAGGVPCGAITGLMAATQKRLVRRYYTSPPAVATIPDATARYYTTMRLALPRDVAFMIAANPATLLLLARTADEHRETIIRDIRDGTLSTRFDLPPRQHAAIAARLRPDPDCARRLENLVSRHGRLRPRDYWNLGFLAHWTGGTLGLYRARFPEWFGDIPVRDPGLIASEGRMSIPLADNSAAGLLDVLSHYFEFIPADDYENSPRNTLTIEQLEIGREYFLLLTNAAGLCRYDIGDRVRVTGWLGQAPFIEFLGRGSSTSSLAGEKLTEQQAVAAMQSLRDTGRRASERFVLAPHFADPPNYLLFIEASAEPTELADAFDAALCRLNIEYESKRRSARLDAVRVVSLPAGTLDRFDDAARHRQGGRREQFKPRYLVCDETSIATLSNAARESAHSARAVDSG